MTVLIYSWYSFSEYSAQARWFIVMNYLVHSVMYTYYALKSIRYFTIALYPYIYSNNAPPPGESSGMAQTPSVGYHRIRLDPQGPKKSAARQISGPDQRGSRRQVPGGPEPGRPQESFFWESC